MLLDASFSIGILKANLLLFVLHKNKILTIFCCWSPALENASPERNLRPRSAYFMGEVVTSIQKVYP